MAPPPATPPPPPAPTVRSHKGRSPIARVKSRRSSTISTPPPRPPDEARASATRFSKSAVFLGTDAKERWDLAAFQAYAHPVFATGKGWTYHSTRRAITFTQDGGVAYFDEDLANDRIGPTRGSGVLLRENDRYLVAQYNLTLTIPNERVSAVRAAIDGKDEAKPAPFGDRYHAELRKERSTSRTKVTSPARKELPRIRPRSEDASRARSRISTPHNQLTWLAWAQNDLMGALEEVEAGKSIFIAIVHSTLGEPEKRKLRLHEMWDRAYLLLDLSFAQPAFSRAATLAKAKDARSEYDALAKSENDKDGAAVLEAYFALKTTKNRDAMTAAKKVDAEKDSDVQDLYVIEDALLAGGDKDGAAKVGAQICAGHAYLMKPLILSRRKLEGRTCP